MDKVEEYLKTKNILDKLIVFDFEIPTVSIAAEALGCSEGEIAKTLALKIEDKCILIVMAGDVKIDNKKYRDEFKIKAAMIDYNEVEEKTGFKAGGVCPFASKEGVEVYLDNSLKKYTIVYPAAGKRNNCIKLSIEELEKYVNFKKWIDVTKEKVSDNLNA